MDYRAVFRALPTPYLVLSPELVITDANPAYLEVAGRELADIVGRPVFEAFPGPGPQDPDGGVVKIRASLERARDTGRPDTMPVQKYDLPDPATGGFAERYWSLISVPVLDEHARCVQLLQRAEDVTAYVRDQERRPAAGVPELALQRRTEDAEAGLFARGQELQAALKAEATASRRLVALAETAMLLAGAQTLQTLSAIVLDSGLTALGAQSGMLAILDEERRALRLDLPLGFGPELVRHYGEAALDGPLPTSVSAATGRPVLLRDAAASRGFAREFGEVLDATGTTAWAALPLLTGGRSIGSLAIGWRQAQSFSPPEVGVLAGFAAQCAQAVDRILIRQAERVAHHQVRRLAETLQRSLLTEPPQPDDLQIAVRYLPAAEQAQIGGDWYDAFVVGDRDLTLVIGDVAGHDRNAAAVMAQLRNVLRGIAHTLCEPPAEMLSALDRAMADLEVGSLATALVANIERVDGGRPIALDPGCYLLRWSNAGHPPPLVLEADGTAWLLSREPDLLLGLDPSTSRSDHTYVLRPGATLLLYTDGLVERRGASIDDGLAWLTATVSELAHLPLEELLDSLLAHLIDGIDDDAALLGLRIAGRTP